MLIPKFPVILPCSAYWWHQLLCMHFYFSTVVQIIPFISSPLLNRRGADLNGDLKWFSPSKSCYTSDWPANSILIFLFKCYIWNYTTGLESGVAHFWCMHLECSAKETPFFQKSFRHYTCLSKLKFYDLLVILIMLASVPIYFLFKVNG